MAKIEKRTYKSFKVSVSSDEARRITALRSDPATADAWHDVPVRMTVTFADKPAAEALAARYQSLGVKDVSVKEKSSTGWQVRIRIKGAPHLTKTFAGKGHAESWAREREGEIAKRQFVDYREADRHTVADLLKKYDTERRGTRHVNDPDRSRVRSLCAQAMAALPISRLTAEDLCEFRDSRLAGAGGMAAVKGTTVKKELELLCRVIGLAMREWRIHLPFNPASASRVARPAPEAGDERNRRIEDGHVPLVNLQKQSEEQPTANRRRKSSDDAFERDEEIEHLLAMPQSEQQALLRAARYPRWFTERKKDVSEATLRRRASIKAQAPVKARLLAKQRTWAMISFAIETATRRGEMCQLQWKDVHLDDGYMLLPSSITKSGKERIVPLSLRATRILATQPRMSDLVFATNTEAIKSAFRRARARAGIVGLREHDLRHESTSRLFEQTTLRAVEIGHMTGHSDPRMLQRYNNLRPREFVEMFKQARRIRQPDVS